MARRHDGTDDLSPPRATEPEGCRGGGLSPPGAAEPGGCRGCGITGKPLSIECRSCMERPATTTRLRIGACCVNPISCEISRDGETARVEVRTMRLLLCLVEHAGEVVSIEQLLNEVWSG